MITFEAFKALFGRGTAKSSLTPPKENNEAPPVRSSGEEWGRSLEPELDKLVSEYFWHAHLPDAFDAIQAFIDELDSIESRAQGE
tara:strand:+ start:2839 stop:3093 length:255 start_codon:yes stop_codon:yes gene_type:complete